MPRVLLLLLPLLAATSVTRAADVFVIADTANQTITIAENAKETIAEANDIVLANDTVVNLDDEHEPVVRKKRTFGDVVFRGLADVLGYSVARKPPQVAFPPPLGPVPGIDAPLQAANPPQQAIPFALVPVALAAAPAPAPAQAAQPCGALRAAGPVICRAQAAAAPPPKPTQPPCLKPRANLKPKPKPQAVTTAQAPCVRGRANPTTQSPCALPPAPSTPPKADNNLETITSNFRLDFNFNRAQATPAPAQAAEEEQAEQQEQEQIVPVAIQPRAAKLPPEQPRTPRVYVDAFVVRNGVAKKVHAVDARNLNQNQNQNQADDDYLVYDEEEQPQQNREDDYEYVEESRDRKKAVRDFGQAVDRFWDQKQRKPKKRLPANDYRNIHFGDRDFVNQLRYQNDEKLQSLQNAQPKSNRIPLPLPEAEEEDEFTTTTQDPRRRLKPRVLPPTEHNPNQIDTVTVRVPPIYKEKRPKKLHRERPERPDRDEEDEEIRDSAEREYSYDSDTDNSDTVSQTEKPKRKRRRKPKRRTRSLPEAYSAGDYDYYGKKLPISDEEKFFRGLTIPPPTKDADLARLEESKTGDGHFLDDHERLRDEKERIKDKSSNKRKKEKQQNDKERSNEDERADESERSEERIHADDDRTEEDERTDETERSDQLSPNARVRETGYQNNYVHSTNVQVDDPRPQVTAVEKKDIGKA